MPGCHKDGPFACCFLSRHRVYTTEPAPSPLITRYHPRSKRTRSEQRSAARPVQRVYKRRVEFMLLSRHAHITICLCAGATRYTCAVFVRTITFYTQAVQAGGFHLTQKHPRRRRHERSNPVCSQQVETYPDAGGAAAEGDLFQMETNATDVTSPENERNVTEILRESRNGRQSAPVNLFMFMLLYHTMKRQRENESLRRP